MSVASMPDQLFESLKLQPLLYVAAHMALQSVCTRPFGYANRQRSVPRMEAERRSGPVELS